MVEPAILTVVPLGTEVGAGKVVEADEGAGVGEGFAVEEGVGDGLFAD